MPKHSIEDAVEEVARQYIGGAAVQIIELALLGVDTLCENTDLARGEFGPPEGLLARQMGYSVAMEQVRAMLQDLRGESATLLPETVRRELGL